VHTAELALQPLVELAEHLELASVGWLEVAADAAAREEAAATVLS
jgi:hypothetical protein